jgi:hypothetical protein
MLDLSLAELITVVVLPLATYIYLVRNKYSSAGNRHHIRFI